MYLSCGIIREYLSTGQCCIFPARAVRKTRNMKHYYENDDTIIIPDYGVPWITVGMVWNITYYYVPVHDTTGMSHYSLGTHYSFLITYSTYVTCVLYTNPGNLTRRRATGNSSGTEETGMSKPNTPRTEKHFSMIRAAWVLG